MLVSAAYLSRRSLAVDDRRVLLPYATSAVIDRRYKSR